MGQVMGMRSVDGEQIEIKYRLVKAERKGIKALILLFGHSGCGKTKSALRLAEGLVASDRAAGKPGLIALLDTEHGRGKHYANEHEYLYSEMKAPFSPAEYARAAADFQAQGVSCMIIDSISHVQEGEGGLIDMAEAAGAAMRGDSYAKWNKPKAEWKRALNRLLQSDMHIIFCARAKNPMEEGFENGKKVYGPGPLTPITPARFPYEITVSLGLDVETHQIIPVKLSNELMGAFPLDQYINEQSGEMVAQWLDGQKVIDKEMEYLKDAGRDAARKGPQQLRMWWDNLAPRRKRQLADFKDTELKPLIGSPSNSPASTGGGFVDERDDPPPEPSQESLKFPSIEMSDPPNWEDVAGQIIDQMDANPDLASEVLMQHHDLLSEMDDHAPDAKAFIMAKVDELNE